jgi:hypothetical protein
MVNVAQSVTIISWSDIPGALFDDFMSDEFVVRTISSRLLPLLGCELEWVKIQLKDSYYHATSKHGRRQRVRKIIKPCL